MMIRPPRFPAIGSQLVINQFTDLCVSVSWVARKLELRQLKPPQGHVPTASPSEPRICNSVIHFLGSLIKPNVPRPALTFINTRIPITTIMKSITLLVSFAAAFSALSLASPAGQKVRETDAEWQYTHPGRNFTLRADPNHPSEEVRSLGFLNRLNYAEKLFEGSPQPITRRPQLSPDERFVGAEVRGDYATGSVIRDMKNTAWYLIDHDMYIMRLQPGLFDYAEGQSRYGTKGPLYVVNQDEFDWDTNQYYKAVLDNRGDHPWKGYGGDCSQQHHAVAPCWYSEKFTVTKDGSGEWFGYNGQYESFWAQCKFGDWTPESLSGYQLRAVNGKKMENCTEPFKMEVVWLD